MMPVPRKTPRKTIKGSKAIMLVLLGLECSIDLLVMNNIIYPFNLNMLVSGSLSNS